MSLITGIILLAVITAVACSLTGSFVVLRRNSMLVDAISHAVFPGIVVGYFFTHDLDSPLLVFGAAIGGLIVVLGSEWLTRTGLVAGDAPQGLIFPALFSVGVIMITANFANIHLDVHAVLVGDLNLAAYRHLKIDGVSYGPEYMYVMLGTLIINIAFIWLFYPKLKATTFDSEFAQSVGIRSGYLNAAFMFLVSMTITAAFNAAGAILVIALIVVPAATAHLVTRSLPALLVVSAIFAAIGAYVGFWMAYVFSAPTSAGMSVFYGLFFVAVLGIVKLREWLIHKGFSRKAEAPVSA